MSTEVKTFLKTLGFTAGAIVILAFVVKKLPASWQDFFRI